MGDPSSKKFEAFSYLPTMPPARIKKQLAYVVDKGWDCMIEHVEPAHASDGYWYMWKLPMFGERDPEAILAEAMACRTANPKHHVRISAIDRMRQIMAFSLVVHRADL